MITHGPQNNQSNRQYSSMGRYNLSGLGAEAAQTYMGGEGSKIIGQTVDIFTDQIIMPLIAGFAPWLSTSLYMASDIVAYAAHLIQVCIGAYVDGCAMYLPSVVADAVLTDIQNKKIDYMTDAIKDCFSTMVLRITPTGSPSKDKNEGRDGTLALLMGKAFQLLGLDANNTRVFARLYKMSTELGAADWQAAAACSHGYINGLQSEGVPTGFAIKTGIGLEVPIKAPIQGGGLQPAPAGVLMPYLAMIGPNPEPTTAWIEAAFKAKSGGKMGKGGGGGVAAALPLLAVAALAWLTMKGK